MSKDKHKGVERRKFVLANLPLRDHGSRRTIRGHLPDPSPHRGAVKQRPSLDVTQEVKRLEKTGALRRKRTPLPSGIKLTVLVPK